MLEWYGVRCIFRWSDWDNAPYEERITIWRAESPESAIEQAEREANEYAMRFGHEFIGFSQCYAMREEGDIVSGAEVFSLLRDSSLESSDYLDKLFDTGAEHEAGLG
jgi:hypothetical protein